MLERPCQALQALEFARHSAFVAKSSHHLRPRIDGSSVNPRTEDRHVKAPRVEPNFGSARSAFEEWPRICDSVQGKVNTHRLRGFGDGSLCFGRRAQNEAPHHALRDTGHLFALMRCNVGVVSWGRI